MVTEMNVRCLSHLQFQRSQKEVSASNLCSYWSTVCHLVFGKGMSQCKLYAYSTRDEGAGIITKHTIVHFCVTQTRVDYIQLFHLVYRSQLLT